MVGVIDADAEVLDLAPGVISDGQHLVMGEQVGVHADHAQRRGPAGVDGAAEPAELMLFADTPAEPGPVVVPDRSETGDEPRSLADQALHLAGEQEVAQRTALGGKPRDGNRSTGTEVVESAIHHPSAQAPCGDGTDEVGEVVDEVVAVQARHEAGVGHGTLLT